MLSGLTIRKDEDVLNWLVIEIKTGERLNCDIWRLGILLTENFGPELISSGNRPDREKRRSASEKWGPEVL